MNDNRRTRTLEDIRAAEARTAAEVEENAKREILKRLLLNAAAIIIKTNDGIADGSLSTERIISNLEEVVTAYRTVRAAGVERFIAEMTNFPGKLDESFFVHVDATICEFERLLIKLLEHKVNDFSSIEVVYCTTESLDGHESDAPSEEIGAAFIVSEAVKTAYADGEITRYQGIETLDEHITKLEAVTADEVLAGTAINDVAYSCLSLLLHAKRSLLY